MKPEQSPDSEPIFFSQAEGGLQKLEKDISPEDVDRLRDVLQIFLTQELANSRVHQDTGLGAAFPVTHIRLADIARAVYQKYRGSLPETKAMTDAHARKAKQIFLMVSATESGNGHHFDFAEQAIHEIIKHLPTALECLAAGQEPPDITVTTLGNPTNKWGRVSEEFLKHVKQDPFGTYGELYTNFMRGTLSTEHPERNAVELYGISMGGSLAAATAKKLLDAGIVTQEKEDETRPHLTVSMANPVGLLGTRLAPLQIAAGYFAERIWQLLTNPAVRLNAKEMELTLTKAEEVLQEQGVLLPETTEDIARKRDVRRAVLWKLLKGIPVDQGVRVNAIRGMNDPTMWRPSFSHAAAKKRKKAKETLGAATVHEDAQTRTFGVHMTHLPPFQRDNEMKRWKRLTAILKDLAQKE